MNLYLMRHAIAADGFTDDSQRPLTEKGRKKLGEVAQTMKKLDLGINFILVSPYLRTRQTAAVVAEALEIGSEQTHQTENLTPYGSAEKLVEEINARAAVENLLLVGHEPLLSQLIGILVAGADGLNINMKKAGLCKLSVDRLVCGRCATLEWFLPPQLLMTI